MSFDLSVRTEMQGPLIAEARRRGVSPQEMLDDLVRRELGRAAVRADDGARRERAARSAEYRRWAASQPAGAASLSDEAISREAIYSREGGAA
jgi:hypothetical protein